MDSKRFEEIAKIRVAECLELMEVVKGLEYSRGGDRLSNFKRAGELQHVTPEVALLGMMSKHLVSIIDIIYDIDKGIPFSLPQLQEKITDTINYFLLLEGLVEERCEFTSQES
jgi:hypothetical protein